MVKWQCIDINNDANPHAYSEAIILTYREHRASYCTDTDENAWGTKGKELELQQGQYQMERTGVALLFSPWSYDVRGNSEAGKKIPKVQIQFGWSFISSYLSTTIRNQALYWVYVLKQNPPPQTNGQIPPSNAHARLQLKGMGEPLMHLKAGFGLVYFHFTLAWSFLRNHCVVV